MNGTARRALDAVPAAVVSAGLAFYAVWTVGCHCVSFAALPFAALYAVLALAAAAALAALRLGSAVDALFAPSGCGLPGLAIPRWTDLSARARIAVGAGALPLAAAAGLEYERSRFLPLWALCATLALLAVLRPGALAAAPGGRLQRPRAPFPAAVAAAEGARRLAPPAPSAVAPGCGVGLGFLVTAGAMLAFYFVTCIPDADDSLYLNLAVGALRDRHAVFAHDSMLGLPDLAFIKSTYRLESYELLAAVVAALTGGSVLLSAHAVVAAAALTLAAAALVLIHRSVLAGQWRIGLTAHLLLLLFLDGSLESFGYHAIPRFFQGKAPFVMALVPFICVTTVLALRSGRWLAIVLLAAAMAASVGLTANAVFAAPLAAALMAAPLFLLGDRRRRMTCLRLALPVAYPALLVGYLLLRDPPGPSEFTDAGTIGSMLWGVFSSREGLAVALALLVVGASCALFDAALAGVALYVLVLLLAVLDPWTWDLYGRKVTGNLNYRLLWSVPLPLILAVLTAWAWRHGTRVRAALVALLALSLASSGSILRHVHWRLSATKVPEGEYALARAVNELTPVDGLILAPEEIAAWIPTLDDARAVVEARALYLPQRAAAMPARQFELRSRLFREVSSPRGADGGATAASLDELGVSGVLVRSDADSSALRAAMAANPAFAQGKSLGNYVFFARR